MIGIALAVGIGVQLGESAIRAIDPVHFQGPAPTPQAVDPNAPPAQPSYADAYGWADGDAARRADSGLPDQDFDYLPQPTMQPAAQPTWQAPPPAPVNLTPWRPGQVSAHPEVERYADFPIEEKPAARPAPDHSADDPPSAATPEPQPDEAPPAN